MNDNIDLLADWAPNGNLASLPMVSPEQHCGALRRLAGPVTIITTGGGETPAGLTATAVASVTADPPRLIVFVNKKVSATSVILDSGTLCVNILAADQEDVARAFAGMMADVAGPARFEHGDWDQLLTGAPALIGALASLDCRVIRAISESTHHAFLCEVLATREREGGAALIYLNGGFQNVPQSSPERL